MATPGPGPVTLADCVGRAQRSLAASVSDLSHLAADLQTLVDADSAPLHRGWLACVQSRLLVKQGDFEAGLQFALRGRQLSMLCADDEDLQLYSLRAYANALAPLGRWVDYVATHTQVLAIIRRRDDRLSEVEIFNTIGYGLIVAGLNELAVHVLDQGAHLLEGVLQEPGSDARGVGLAQANNVSNLAAAWLELYKGAKANSKGPGAEQAAKAHAYAEQAYLLAQAVRNAHLCAGAQDTLAELHLIAGRLTQARRAIVIARRHAARAGPGPQALTDAMSAAIDLAAGKPQRALKRLMANADRAIAQRPSNDLELRHLRTLVAARRACGQWQEAFHDQAALLEAERRIASQRLSHGASILLHQFDNERRETERLLSHDLRTPLAAVVASLEGLTSADARSTTALAHALGSAKKALAVNDAFLAKVRSALLSERQFRPVDLVALVDDVCEEMRCAAHANHLHVVAQVDDALMHSGARSMGSHEYLRRALVNLLDNAIRHAPPHSQVTVGIAPRQGQWCVTVTDDGPGFPHGPLTTIVPGLGLAVQVPPTTQTGAQWLGLRQVYQVVERHRGTLRLGRHGRHGALVEICLPAWVAPASPAT